MDLALADGSSALCSVPPSTYVVADVVAVREVWTRPYTPVLVTGGRLDVVEGPSKAVGPLVRALQSRGVVPPIASVPGRLQLLTESVDLGDADEALLAGVEILHHGAGSWVPLPTTDLPHAGLQWIRRPNDPRVIPASATAIREVLPVLLGHAPSGAADTRPGGGFR